MAFPTGWARKAKLTIQASKIDATLTDYPSLLKRYPFPDEMFDSDGPNHALSDGGDIRFSSDEFGVNQLPCEIEAFHLDEDATRPNSAQIWVKVPTVSSSADTKIWVWYKKSGESQPAVDSAFGRNAVWSDYVSVYHMNEESGSTVVDSAGNHNGAYQGSLPNNTWSKIGQGQDFNGTSDYFTVSDHADFNQYQDTTIQIWAYSHDQGGEWRGVFTKDREQFSAPTVGIWRSDDASGLVGCRVGQSHDDGQAFTQSTWKSIYLSWAENGGSIRSTVDGSADWTGSTTASGEPSDGSYAVNVGRSGGESEFFDGVLVEARWRHGILSDVWRSTEYNNHNVIEDFWTEGTPVSALIVYPNSIVSGEAFGQPTLAPGNVDIVPNGIVSQEAFGSPTLDLIIYISSIDSSEAFGSPSVFLAQDITPNSIVSGEAFGSPTLDLIIYISSIDSSEAFGSLTLKYDQTTAPDSIPSSEAFGLLEIGMEITGAGNISSEEAWGNPIVSRGPVYVTPNSILSGEAFGQLTISAGNIYIQATSIPSGEAFGNVILNMEIKPDGISSAEAFGAPTILPGNVGITSTGIVSAEAFGVPTIDSGVVVIETIGIVSEEAFGSLTVVRGGVAVSAGSIATGEQWGSPTIGAGSAYIQADSILSSEAFGSISISTGNVNIVPNGIESDESFGVPYITVAGVQISPYSIASSEIFGSLSIVVSGVEIRPISINSEEQFGEPEVLAGNVNISPNGIASAESFGSVNIVQSIQVDSIISSEAFGAVTISTGNVDISPIGIVSQEAFGLHTVRHVLILDLTGSGIPSSEGFGTPIVLAVVLNSFMTQMETDLEEGFFNDEEFADEYTYIHQNGYSFPLTGIFDEDTVLVDPDTMASVTSRNPLFTCQTSDFKFSPTKGDKMIINGTNYQVVHAEPDGTGVSEIELHYERTV